MTELSSIKCAFLCQDSVALTHRRYIHRHIEWQRNWDFVNLNFTISFHDQRFPFDNIIALGPNKLVSPKYSTIQDYSTIHHDDASCSPPDPPLRQSSSHIHYPTNSSITQHLPASSLRHREACLPRKSSRPLLQPSKCRLDGQE